MLRKYKINYDFRLVDGRWVRHKAIVETTNMSLTTEEIEAETVKTIMKSGYFYFRSEKTNTTVGVNINNVICVEVYVTEVEDEEHERI